MACHSWQKQNFRQPKILPQFLVGSEIPGGRNLNGISPGENLATILETKCGACSYVKPTLMNKDLPNQIIPVKF